MPSRSIKSRSLFASLPFDLKKSIRAQQLDSVEVKSELLETAAASGLLLPTQPLSPNTLPSSSSSTPPEHLEPLLSEITTTTSLDHAEVLHITTEGLAIEEAALNDNPEASLKRPASSPLNSPSSSKITTWSTPRAQRPVKKQKGKGRAWPWNDHEGHPWDCTGLVPRYSNYDHVPKHLAKYFAQRHLLFPLYDTLPILLDDTGWFSVTPQPIAAHIADRCQCDVIIDAFCGVGGNAIEFARTCERVIAIDNDPVRLRLARHNALHHGVADRIEFVLADFVDFARVFPSQPSRSSAVDAVFLSPPWGGPNYLQRAEANYFEVTSTYSLSSILPIHGKELFQLASSITPNIAYFLPRNVDVTEISLLAKTLTPDDEAEGSAIGREWVEIEEEWVGPALKAVTAYYGDLVASE